MPERQALIGPRKRPCASCPYPRTAPSGLWHADEYAKLARFDGPTEQQAAAGAFAPFMCHQQTGELCAGWVGCHDMDENLAIRIAAIQLDLDVDAIRSYVSPVPLFASGREAAEHGLRDIDAPGPDVRRKALGLLRLQGRRTRRPPG